MEAIRPFFGLLLMLVILVALSSNRRKIDWSMVIKGLLIQVVLAYVVLEIQWVSNGFDWVGKRFVDLLNFSRAGSEFLFGGLVVNTDSFGYLFAFQVLPTIVFFSAITSLLFHFGILQRVVWAFAWIMRRTLKLSGAESLAAAANVFVGQTEAPLLIKPYIAKMTRSELLCLMTGGMATIAGAVLVAFIELLGGSDPDSQAFFARHFLTASVMSAPAAIVASKILLPETQAQEDSAMVSVEKQSNVLEAMAQGTTDGLKMAVNVGVMLLVFTAMVALLNSILGDGIGEWTGLNGFIASFTDGQFDSLSMESFFGIILAPFAWMMGVPWEESMVVGQLLGEKTVLNEFYAYTSMKDLMAGGHLVSERAQILSVYILCGFANFASIGIQIGGIGVLAPGRRKDLSRLGFKALVAGTVASLFTATLVGIIL